jgi:nicotinamidase-related amidase
VVLMGVATEFVVEAAAKHAADADFRVIVLEDCCAAF